MLLFVKLNNAGEIEQYPYTLDMFRADNKNTSFPKVLNNTFLIQKNVRPVYEDVKPDYDSITQILSKKSTPVLKDNNWIVGWDTIQKSQETIDSEKLALENKIRSIRDENLTETDWVPIKYLEDGISVPQEWKDYRQALRDIPKQENFPYAVTWPTKP